MKRVFFAVAISDSARAEAAAHINYLRREFPEARVTWVRPANLHITIKFIGEVEPEQIAKATAAASSVPACANPFRIRLGVPGSFGEKVLYISLIDEVCGLSGLSQALETGLERTGFPKEKRPFRSHLTIGRVRSGEIKPLIKWHRSASVEPIEIEVSRLILFESLLMKAGPEYRVLAEFPFTPKMSI